MSAKSKTKWKELHRKELLQYLTGCLSHLFPQLVLLLGTKRKRMRAQMRHNSNRMGSATIKLDGRRGRSISPIQARHPSSSAKQIDPLRQIPTAKRPPHPTNHPGTHPSSCRWQGSLVVGLAAEWAARAPPSCR